MFMVQLDVRRGQGSFEYTLLLAGVLLLVVLILGFLRSTSTGVEANASGGINRTLSAFNYYANISNENLSNLPGATPYSTGSTATPTATLEPCRDGTNASTCVIGRPPLYCRFGGTDYVDRCDLCGCPQGKTCDTTSKRCGVYVTPPPTPTPSPTPASSAAASIAPAPAWTGFQPFDNALSSITRLLDEFTRSTGSTYSGFFGLFRGSGRLVAFLIAVGAAAICAFVVYAFFKKRKV